MTPSHGSRAGEFCDEFPRRDTRALTKNRRGRFAPPSVVPSRSMPSLDLVVVRNGMYRPFGGEAVADPSLFVRYPSDGLIANRGTVGPDSWDDAAFLGPIVTSIR